MTSKTTNKFSPEVRARAVRMVTEHEAEHPSRWAAVSSIAAKIGCSAHTLHEWVKKAEVDSGKRAGLPSDVAEKMKALERENRELRQANDVPTPHDRIALGNAREREERVFAMQSEGWIGVDRSSSFFLEIADYEHAPFQI